MGLSSSILPVNIPSSLSGEDVLPGFILDLTEIWQ